MTFQKLSHLGGGVQNVLLERGDKPEREGVDVEMGGCHFFITLQCSSITFTVCVEGGSKVPFIPFGSSVI